MIAPPRRLLWARPVITASVVGLLALLELMIRVATGGILASPSFGPLKFGRVPLEVVGSAYFLGLLAVELWTIRPHDEVRQRLPFYRFVLAILGMALVVWAGLARQGRAVPVEYLIGTAAIVFVFVYAGWTHTDGAGGTMRHVMPDFAAFARRSTTWGAAAIAVVLVVWGPREAQTESIRSGADFETWFISQPRRSFPELSERAPVVIAEFVDYQCPFCRDADRRYGALFRELREMYPDAVKLLRFDFPLETECNDSKGMQNVHSSACEAAVAVRIARSVGKHADMEAWLWAHQSALSRDLIFDQIRILTGITDAETRYPAVLDLVRTDVRISQQFPVRQTPTFWVNGVLLSGISARSFRWAVMHELRTRQTRETSRCHTACGGHPDRLAGPMWNRLPHDPSRLCVPG